MLPNWERSRHLLEGEDQEGVVGLSVGVHLGHLLPEDPGHNVEVVDLASRLACADAMPTPTEVEALLASVPSPAAP